MTDYQAAGVPIWVDVSSGDLDKTVDFYTGLFGWGANRGGPEMGGYTVFTVDGKMAAGAGPVQSPDAHPAWMTFIQTEDAEATAEKIKSAGGTVMIGPMDVMDLGRMTVFQDPTGAVCGTWQKGTHKGAEVVNEVNSFCWSELYTRDLTADIDFYRSVFGYDLEVADVGGGRQYHMFKVGDRAIAGAMDMAPLGLDDHIPPHWLTYFTVADINDAIKKIGDLGGRNVNGPVDTPMGPFSVVADPEGAVFAVIQFQSQS